eukprot:jgi/Tetstr1/462527/TSEL_007516.t1
MAALSQDCVLDPLGAVRALFQAAHAGSEPPADGADRGVEEYFRAALREPAIAEQIPMFNVDDINLIPNNSLVRFRGMVQDMFNPELFIGAFKEPGASWQTCQYQDFLTQGPSEAAETVMWERRPFYCVPVPGEAEWFQAAAMPAAKRLAVPGRESRDKRQRDDTSASDSDLMSVQTAEGEGMECGEEVASGPHKQVRQEAANGGAPAATGAAPLAPPRAGGQDCILHVYNASAKILLNEVVEVVGVLSCAPELAQTEFGGVDDMVDEEELAVHPPTSKVPRIHALVLQKAEPGLPVSGKPPAPLAAISQVREEAIRVLSAVLGNDRLAAEYTLLHLLSRVIARQDTVNVGALSLNVTGWPEMSAAGPGGLSSAGAVLVRAFHELVPHVVGVPMTVDHLNRTPMVPSKDYTTNRLRAAPLQVPAGTHCVLDESCMKAGELVEQGILNLQSFQAIATGQEIDYDFQYYKMPMKTDIPILALSAQRSLLRESLGTQVPLHATTAVGHAEALDAALAVSNLPLIREYLAQARRMDFELPEEVASLVEASISSYKKETTSSIDPSVFHRWLTMARLLAGSKGETAMSEETWKAVMAMEHQREERVRVV